MIGVVANSSDEAVVREFFELFKTPWELYQSCRKYDVILVAGSRDFDGTTASLIVVYSGLKFPADIAEPAYREKGDNQAAPLRYGKFQIPIYGRQLIFGSSNRTGVDTEFPDHTICSTQSNGTRRVRVGYDLFDEVRTLLTNGQPVVNAGIPALDLHIALLRQLIVESGIHLIEIPPVPEGCRFIVCLTHDVDHPLLRRHKFDHTMLGFVYRAFVGTLIAAIVGRRPWRHVWTNWLAVLKLPLVHLGLSPDPWAEIERYLVLENGASSSFFVIPFAGQSGRQGGNAAPSARAAAYGAADISSQIRNLVAADCEVALHGIDAWMDTSAAANELDAIRSITGKEEVGVRMHWLYFDTQTPLKLERAGASYDSSFGYNETVGYRAGTSQGYKPLVASRLIELPLHLMDTALFYPSYLNLTPEQAYKRVGPMIENVVEFGGCLTINWHDRSIAPERLWGDFYVALVAELRKKGAWFATATQAAAWFRKRRSAVFENVAWETEAVRVQIGAEYDDLPGLQLRVHDVESCQTVGFAGEEASQPCSTRVGWRALETCIALTNAVEVTAASN